MTNACVDVSPTEMIYMTYDGNFEMRCDAKILHTQAVEVEGDAADSDAQTVHVYLDRTVLHAQGGGQPTDIGTMKIETGASTVAVQVEKVTMDRSTGVALHRGKVMQSTAEAEDGVHASIDDVKVGDKVHVEVDADNRQILSECHTAGHVVDSAMARCGSVLPPSKAYHFLDGPYVEYKGKIPAEERNALLAKLKVAFQELVEEDICTKIAVLSKSDAEAVCNRVAENYFNMEDFDDDNVRIVTVAGWPCPCGGTHVRSTGNLKERKWGVTGLKCKKGVVRVKYGKDC